MSFYQKNYKILNQAILHWYLFLLNKTKSWILKNIIVDRLTKFLMLANNKAFFKIINLTNQKKMSNF